MSPLACKVAGLLIDYPDVAFTAEDLAELCGCTVHGLHNVISELRRHGINPTPRRVYTMRGFWKSGAEVVSEREAA